jgi:hypothetical protein
MATPFGVHIPEDYRLSSGELSPEGYRLFQQQFKDPGTNVDWTAILHLEPGGWSELANGEFYYNNTETPQDYEIHGTAGDDETNFEIEFGAGPDAVEAFNVGYVQFISIYPNITLFSEPFESIVSLDMGDAGAVQPSGLLETDTYSWSLSYLTNRDEGFAINVSNGLVMTLSRDPYYSGRGVRLTPVFSAEGPDMGTDVVLNVSSELLEDFDFGGGGEGVIYEETGYWGVWVQGADSSCLWVDCSDAPPDYAHLPAESLFGGSEYSYVTLGPGEKSLDLSQFDELLNGQVVSLAFEAYIHPLVN